jgi:hypothetical protein
MEAGLAERDVRDEGGARGHEAPGLEVFAILLDDLDDAESVLLRQRGAPGTGGQLWVSASSSRARLGA